ncbi:MAG: hypothetical protein F6K31_07280 [Symploca sp. SIO2G7]|nr:hypothetical protein [Symploca sp. SIO2G7]
MKLSYCGLPTQAINFDTVSSEVNGGSLSVNELIQTALQKTISIFLALVFTVAAIVALPVSVVVVAVAFPVFALFKSTKVFAARTVKLETDDYLRV